MDQKKTLTKTIAKTREADNANDEEKGKVLSKVIITSTTEKENEFENDSEHYDITEIESLKTPIDLVANWLLKKFGETPFLNIKENPHLSLPFSDEGMSIDEWLKKTIKTIFTYRDLQSISNTIDKEIQNEKLIKNNFQSEILDLKNQLEKEKELSQNMKDNYEKLKTEHMKILKKSSVSFSLNMLVDETIEHTRTTEQLLNLLYETIESPNEDLVGFMLSFCRSWVLLKDTLSMDNYDKEEEYLDDMDSCLKKLLANISGKTITQRRAILKEIAKIVSLKFNEYEFVSPEETKQVDPMLHNASGSGGTTVIEGLSFAVVRKQNRQTVRYAEIKSR